MKWGRAMERRFLLVLILSLAGCREDQGVAPRHVPELRTTTLPPANTNKAGVYYMSRWTTDPNLLPLRYNWQPLQAWDSLHTTTSIFDNFREPHWLAGFYDGAIHRFYDNARQEVVDNNILGIYDAKF